MADVGLRVPCTPRLNRRSLTNLLRNKMLFAARIGQTVFLGQHHRSQKRTAQQALPSSSARNRLLPAGALGPRGRDPLTERLHTPVRTFFAGLCVANASALCFVSCQG